MRITLNGFILVLTAHQALAAVPDFIPAKDYERFERAVDRKIKINPQPPKTGIDSGLVIYMGHPIPRPYSVEWQGEKILINGVPVLPTREWEQSNAQLQASLNSRTPEQKRRGQIEWEATNEIQEMARRGSSRSEIFRFAKAQKCFSSVGWAGDNALDVTGADGRLVVELPRKGDAPARVFTDKEKAEMLENSHKREKENIEKILKQDRMVLISAMTGPMGQDRTLEFPSTVPTIMDDPKLDLKEKYKRIKAISWQVMPDLAWEIVENYDPKEWRSMKVPARGPR